MPAQSRLGDKSMVPADGHGCPGCPHPCVGPAVAGSPDVLVNDKPALRVGDPGVHAACCGPNTWEAKMGSATVLINAKPAHRLQDMDKHCGGVGQMIEGSPNVITGGPASSSGAGGGGGGSAGEALSATSGGPALTKAVKALAKKALEEAQKLGAQKLSELANKGIAKGLAKLGLKPGAIDKIMKVVGPAVNSIVDDLVHGKPPNFKKAFGAALDGAVDVVLQPIKDKIDQLAKGLEEELNGVLGEANDQLGAAVKGAISKGVAQAVGEGLKGALSGFAHAAVHGENPWEAALQGLEAGAIAGAKKGAKDGAKEGWESYQAQPTMAQGFAAGQPGTAGPVAGKKTSKKAQHVEKGKPGPGTTLPVGGNGQEFEPPAWSQGWATPASDNPQDDYKCETYSRPDSEAVLEATSKSGDVLAIAKTKNPAAALVISAVEVAAVADIALHSPNKVVSLINTALPVAGSYASGVVTDGLGPAAQVAGNHGGDAIGSGAAKFIVEDVLGYPACPDGSVPVKKED